jgi:hypothetical protein
MLKGCPAAVCFLAVRSLTMAASQADDGVDKVIRVLWKILEWMDAHDDVLPKVHTKPANASQREETALANAYKWVRKGSDAYTKQQHLLQQDMDHMATDPRDLQNIEDINEWSSRNNGRLPMQTKDDKDQTFWAKKLNELLHKDPTSPMLQRRLAQLHENAHQTPTKASQRGAMHTNRKRDASSFLQRLKEEHEEWCGLRFSSQEATGAPGEVSLSWPGQLGEYVLRERRLSSLIPLRCSSQLFTQRCRGARKGLQQASQTRTPRTSFGNCRASRRNSLTVFLLSCLASDAASILGHRMPLSTCTCDVAL